MKSNAASGLFTKPAMLLARMQVVWYREVRAWLVLSMIPLDVC